MSDQQSEHDGRTIPNGEETPKPLSRSAQFRQFYAKQEAEGRSNVGRKAEPEQPRSRSARFRKHYAKQEAGRKKGLVGLTPKEALDQAVAYMTREGASVTGRTENSVTFTYHKGPHGLLLIFLLLLFILPGILYWMAASRDTNFTITASPAEGGCKLLVGGEDAAGNGNYYFKRWVKQLPGPNPNLTVADAEPAETNTPSVPDEIRRLAELRDAGIVTNEEFEAKKRELLDRM